MQATRHLQPGKGTWLLLLSITAAFSVKFEELNTPHAQQIMRLAKSADMLAYIDEQVSPCEDFYSHACGNWARINPQASLYVYLEQGYLRRVQRLLQQPKWSTDNAMETRVKYFYDSCLDRAAVRLNSRAKLLALLEEFGGMPALKGQAWQEAAFDWQDMLTQLLRRYGKQTLLAVTVDADLRNNQVNRLFIGQPAHLLTTAAWSYYVGNRITFQEQLEQLLGMSEALASRTAHELTTFEFELALGIAEPLEGRTIDELSRLRLLADMDEVYKPTLNLTRLVSGWLGYEYQLPVYESVEGYFWNLRRLLQKTPKRTVANYMLSLLLQDFKAVAATTETAQRTECARKTAHLFSEYVERMVYRSLEADNPSMPSNFKQLWQQLKQSFAALLQSPSSDWLGEQTRSSALAKLKEMNYLIVGAQLRDFEPEYSTLLISTDDYFGNVRRLLELRALKERQRLLEPAKHTLEAELATTPYYAANYNLVSLPTPYMQQRYFWDEAQPAALQYATVGSALAHEMGHGLDAEGRKFDGKGNLNELWERNATEQFLQRKECLVQQLGGIKYHGVEMPRSQAQDENIADNISVRVAYQAYTSWLEQQDAQVLNETEHLPHMSQTPQQLFFLALAQTWCDGAQYEWRQSMAPAQVHLPGELRVNAMMANYEQFAQAYNCPKDSKMYPTKQCVIY